MYLVLCSASDFSGLWVCDGLRQLGIAPLELVLAESLACASLWEHRLQGSRTHLKITLPDGRTVCSSRIRGVINRLLAPAPGAAYRAAESDREYAQAELHAFYLSWLKGLPGRVVNPPTAVGLSGSWYHASEWVSRASRAGLTVRPYRQSSHDAPEDSFRPLAPEGAARLSLITFGGQLFGGSVSAAIGCACARLAREAQAELLGVELYREGAGAWIFAGATPQPDLSIGGTPLLQCLARELTQGERP